MHVTQWISLKRETHIVLLVWILLAPLAPLLAAQSSSNNQNPVSTPQNSPPAPPLKERVAEAIKRATLRVLRLPLVPVLCFGGAIVGAGAWTWAAIRHRVRILAGTVSIAGTPAPRMSIRVRRGPARYSVSI
jgi:hypothetical protein